MNSESNPPTIQPPATAPPICPHCRREPCFISMQVVSFGGPPEAGGLPVLIFMCGSATSPGCHKILSIAPMPQMIGPPPQAQERRDNLILNPFNGK